MFCNKCGSQIPDGTKFCTNCGNRINTGQNQSVKVLDNLFSRISSDFNSGIKIPFCKKRSLSPADFTWKAK